MVNYQQGKIYKIVCHTTGFVYYGSTCEPSLARRLHQHKLAYVNRSQKPICTSIQILENNNYNIYLVENFPCHNRDELRMRERFYIESNECVNKCIPIRFEEEKNLLQREHYNKNKTERLQNMKKYYELNKAKIDDYQKQYRKQYWEKNKEKKSEYNKQYWKNNKEKKSESSKQYRESNKEKKSESNKRYREKKQVKAFFLNFIKCFDL